MFAELPSVVSQRQQRCQVQQDKDLVGDLGGVATKPTNPRATNARPVRREIAAQHGLRGFHFLLRQTVHLGHFVHHQTDDFAAPFDQQDACVGRRRRDQEPETTPQVDDGGDLPSHRDDPQDVGARPRHFGNGRRLGDLP